MALGWPAGPITVVEAIECMVSVLADRGQEILLMSTVDENDFIGPGESFVLDGGKRPQVSAEVMFEYPARLGAPRLLFGTRSSGSVSKVHPHDRALAEWLIRETTSRGIGVAEIVLTEDNMFRLMVETLKDEL